MDYDYAYPVITGMESKRRYIKFLNISSVSDKWRTFRYERFSGSESTNKFVRAWSNSVEHDAKALMFLVAIFFE